MKQRLRKANFYRSQCKSTLIHHMVCAIYLYSYRGFLQIFLQKIIKRSTLWHKDCFRDICQPSDFVQEFINLIPHELNPAYKQSPSHFTRTRELPFPKLVTFTLSLAASGTHQGVDSKSGQFFRNARRSGLWPDARAVHRGSISKARTKVPWQAFCDILADAVRVSYEVCPKNDPQYLWHGMSVFAIDGSKYNLPATEEIRKTFDPQSGLSYPGKGHYPQCLVSTLYDVFRRLPIARTVTGRDGSEREEMKKLLPCLPPNSLLILDRGFPSYEIIHYLTGHHNGYYIVRCPATSTFPAVEAFIKKGKKDSIIWITPSNKFKRKVGTKQRRAIKLRVIKLVSPDGTVSVLLTNLFNKKVYTHDEIVALYARRWEIENYYRDEKITLEIERFHSKTVNGILQEFYAAMIMSVIARTLMVLSSHVFLSGRQEAQFKNAVFTLASEAALLVPDDAERAVTIFTEVLKEIARVKYYRPKKLRCSQPRINKRPLNKWQQNRIKKLAA